MALARQGDVGGAGWGGGGVSRTLQEPRCVWEPGRGPACRRGPGGEGKLRQGLVVGCARWDRWWEGGGLHPVIQLMLPFPGWACDFFDDPLNREVWETSRIAQGFCVWSPVCKTGVLRCPWSSAGPPCPCQAIGPVCNLLSFLKSWELPLFVRLIFPSEKNICSFSSCSCIPLPLRLPQGQRDCSAAQGFARGESVAPQIAVPPRRSCWDGYS